MEKCLIQKISGKSFFFSEQVFEIDFQSHLNLRLLYSQCFIKDCAIKNSFFPTTE